jgi:hypothetical protein
MDVNRSLRQRPGAGETTGIVRRDVAGQSAHVRASGHSERDRQHARGDACANRFGAGREQLNVEAP